MKLRQGLVFGIVFLSFVTIGIAQKGQPVHWAVTGSTHDLGMNGDIDEGSMGICAGKGTFGEHTCNTMFTGQPHPAPPAPNCYAQLAMFTHIQRFRNGDLLYSRIPSGEPLGDNYLCFNGLEYSGTVTVEFVGGTGRFEGASGWATWVFEGEFLEENYASGINEVNGMIYLNED